MSNKNKAINANKPAEVIARVSSMQDIQDIEKIYGNVTRNKEIHKQFIEQLKLYLEYDYCKQNFNEWIKSLEPINLNSSKIQPNWDKAVNCFEQAILEESTKKHKKADKRQPKQDEKDDSGQKSEDQNSDQDQDQDQNQGQDQENEFEEEKKEFKEKENIDFIYIDFKNSEKGQIKLSNQLIFELNQEDLQLIQKDFGLIPKIMAQTKSYIYLQLSFIKVIDNFDERIKSKFSYSNDTITKFYLIDLKSKMYYLSQLFFKCLDFGQIQSIKNDHTFVASSFVSIQTKKKRHENQQQQYNGAGGDEDQENDDTNYNDSVVTNIHQNNTYNQSFQLQDNLIVFKLLQFIKPSSQNSNNSNKLKYSNENLIQEKILLQQKLKYVTRNPYLLVSQSNENGEGYYVSVFGGSFQYVEIRCGYAECFKISSNLTQIALESYTDSLEIINAFQVKRLIKDRNNDRQSRQSSYPFYAEFKRSEVVENNGLKPENLTQTKRIVNIPSNALIFNSFLQDENSNYSQAFQASKIHQDLQFLGCLIGGVNNNYHFEIWKYNTYIDKESNFMQETSYWDLQKDITTPSLYGLYKIKNQLYLLQLSFSDYKIKDLRAAFILFIQFLTGQQLDINFVEQMQTHIKANQLFANLAMAPTLKILESPYNIIQNSLFLQSRFQNYYMGFIKISKASKIYFNNQYTLVTQQGYYKQNLQNRFPFLQIQSNYPFDQQQIDELLADGIQIKQIEYELLVSQIKATNE